MSTEQAAQSILRRRERSLSSLHLPWPRGTADGTPAPPLEISGDLRIRAASVYDRSVLRTISIEGRAVEFVGLPPELASTLLGMQYAASIRHRAIRWPHATDHVIDHHHVPAGVLTTQVTASEFRLLDIGLLPGFRGQGHAVAVVRAIAQSAAARGLPLRYRASTSFMTESLLRRLGASIVAEGASYLELRHGLYPVSDRVGETTTDERAAAMTADAFASHVAPFRGEIRQWHRDDPPPGWRWCDGSLLQVAEHRELFDLLGNGFGGNGVDTFRIPSLSGTHPPHGAFVIAVDPELDRPRP